MTKNPLTYHLLEISLMNSIYHLLETNNCCSFYHSLEITSSAAPIIHLKLRLWGIINLEVLMCPILLKIRTWSWSFVGFETIWWHCVSIVIKLLFSSFKIITLSYWYILWLLKIIFFIALYKIIIWSFVHIVRIAKTRFFIESIIISFGHMLLIIAFEYGKLLLLSNWIVIMLMIHLNGIVR